MAFFRLCMAWYNVDLISVTILSSCGINNSQEQQNKHINPSTDEVTGSTAVRSTDTFRCWGYRRARSGVGPVPVHKSCKIFM